MEHQPKARFLARFILLFKITVRRFAFSRHTESRLNNRFIYMQINFAETFLNKKIRGSITYIDENLETKTISPERITREILALSSFFRDSGIDEKSTIVCISSNRYEAVISSISTILLGARWSICSPDLGIKSVLDRFDQLKPNILIAGSIHQYNGKEYDSSDKLVGNMQPPSIHFFTH